MKNTKSTSKIKTLNFWTHKELMALPLRQWDEVKEYDSIMIISTRQKHDSGWAVMAIIGVIKAQPQEIACSCCDDIEWKSPPMQTLGHGLTTGKFRTDCALKSGAIHAWQYDSKFKVGIALSSTTIEIVPKR